VNDCFELTEASPYMLLVASVKEALRVNGQNQETVDFMRRLKSRRSTLPAVTHVDYSARVQTVSVDDNPRFHGLLSAFEQRTGCPVLVNTSFNVRGEPPVCTPEDAYRCFIKTEMDYLVLGNCLVDKISRSGAFQTADPKTTAIWKSSFLGEELQKLDCSIAALRRFAFTIAAVLVSLGGIMLWRRCAFGWPLLSLAFLMLATVLLKPKSLRFVYRSWMMLALLLGSVASRILLTFAFFLVLTPLGLVQRLLGKRLLDLRFKSDATSYWQARSGHPASVDYEKQF
jgi:hypothetical protein